MEEGILQDSDDRRDPIPDYKFLETVMDVSQDPRLVNELSDERVLLLLHLMSLGLYYRDKNKLNFKLDPELEKFLIYYCSDCPEELDKARALISEISPDEHNFYSNMMTMMNFIIVDFIKQSSNIDESSVKSGELKFLEQLFTFLEDQEEITKFSDTQFLLLVNLLIYGSYLNEINALGFYLTDEIIDLLKQLTPIKEQLDLLKEHLSQVASQSNESVYENFSGLINYIIYNFLKSKF